MAKPKLTTKSLAAPAAQSLQEAERLVGRIGELNRELIRQDADLGDTLAAAKKAAEEIAAPLKAELLAAHQAVQAWAEANKADLTKGGKTKTVRLSTGDIKWRLRPPSVTLRNVKAIIEHMRKHHLMSYVRAKYEVDKDALGSAPEVAKTIPGVTVASAGEDFIVEPFDEGLAEVRP